MNIYPTVISVNTYNSKGRLIEATSFIRKDVVGWFLSKDHKKKKGFVVGFERKTHIISEWLVVCGDDFINEMKKNDFFSNQSCPTTDNV